MVMRNLCAGDALDPPLWQGSQEIKPERVSGTLTKVEAVSRAGDVTLDPRYGP
jgi:hypothetical protein